MGSRVILINGKDAAIEEDVHTTLDALVDRNPTLGIAVAFTIKNSEAGGGAGLIGQLDVHEMLHAVDTLMHHLLEEGKKIDPAGTASFILELQLRRAGGMT